MASEPHGKHTCREQYVSVLTLNQPTKYNPLSLGVLNLLEKELQKAESEFPRCRCVVVKAAPGKAFSAGHDMKEIHSYLQRKDEGSIRQLFETCSRVMKAFQSIRPVTIASVDGIATAAGCQLIAATDLAIATKASRFALSGIHNGLVCSTPIVAVSRNIASRKHALEMLLTGDFIDADRAFKYGLVNEVVQDSNELEASTMRLAQKIMQHPSYAVTRGKDLFYKQYKMKTTDAYICATDQIVEDIVNSEEAREGIGAFVEKRKPKWQS